VQKGASREIKPISPQDHPDIAAAMEVVDLRGERTGCGRGGDRHQAMVVGAPYRGGPSSRRAGETGEKCE
jgi:hypothetical protein